MKPLWIASAIITLLLAGLGLWFNENLKELLKQWGWNTVLARYWLKLRCNLSWQHLRGLWWLWLSGGTVLALCLTMLLFGLRTFGTPPLPNPLHDEAAKWRVTRNIYDMSLNRNAQAYKKCEVVFVRYPMPYAENYEHDLTEILRVAGWIIHPSSFASSELPRGLSIKALQSEPGNSCAAALYRGLLDDVQPRSLVSGQQLNIKVPITHVPNEMVAQFVKACSDTCVEVDIGNDPKS